MHTLIELKLCQFSTTITHNYHFFPIVLSSLLINFTKSSIHFIILCFIATTLDHSNYSNTSIYQSILSSVYSILLISGCNTSKNMLKHYFLILLLLIPSNSSLSINYPHLKSNRNKINTNNHRPDISTSRYSSLTLLKTTGGDIEEPANRFNNLRRELFAEFIGTFLLVNIGCGTVCSATFK